MTGQAQSDGARLAPGTVAQLALISFLWALCFPLIAVGLGSAPPLTFGGMRALLAGAVLLALVLVLGRPLPRDWRIWLALGLVGLGATTLGYFGMFVAGGLVSPGIATVVENTQPLLAALLAAVLLGERLSRRRRIGLALGFGGILAIGLPRVLGAGEAGSGMGILFVLLGAGGVAIANVVLKLLAGRVDVLVAVSSQLLLGSLPLLVGGWLLERDEGIRWSASFVAALLTLSLLATALASVLWFRLLRRAALGRLTAYAFLTPLFGLSMGMMFFNERFGVWEVLGILLALAGLWQVTRGDRRPQSARSPLRAL
jgi:drug/metabolite transporter (DMT)-like permease